MLAEGRRLSEINCTRCHNIELEGASALAAAPPFRDIVTKYDPAFLEEALVEGIVTGHNDMPEFTFEPDQITAIVAYLQTLRAE